MTAEEIWAESLKFNLFNRPRPGVTVRTKPDRGRYVTRVSHEVRPGDWEVVHTSWSESVALASAYHDWMVKRA